MPGNRVEERERAAGLRKVVTIGRERGELAKRRMPAAPFNPEAFFAREHGLLEQATPSVAKKREVYCKDVAAFQFALRTRPNASKREVERDVERCRALSRETSPNVR